MSDNDKPTGAPKPPLKKVAKLPSNITITTKGPPPPPAREISSVGFPYMDLEAAITVAKAMLQGGGVALTRDQLAGVMGQSAGSGAFVTKVATARMFGVILANNGKYELTDIGFAIVDSDERRQKEARAEAFLNVPLYRLVYDEFRGKQLPPRPFGLEQAFVKFGVAPKQKTNARLAFDKSAAQAGYFPNGQNDRLVAPIIGGSRGVTIEAPEKKADGPSSSSSAAAAAAAAPAIPDVLRSIVALLPTPQSEWPIAERVRWLEMAAIAFSFVYKGEGKIEIKAKNEMDD